MSEDFFYEIWPARSVGNLEVLTYSSENKLNRGEIIEIPLGKKSIAGVVSRKVKKPDFPVKPVSRKIFENNLSKEIVDTAVWISKFYSTKIGVVWQNFLPTGILKKRRFSSVDAEQKIYSKIQENEIKQNKTILTQSQKSALKTIRKMSPGTAILRGITGSGKTEVYKNLAKDMASAGKSVIILVPEISLTTQVVNEFENYFRAELGDQSVKILSTNSQQKETERAKIWENALNSSLPIIAIGPRSALFLPIKNVGLIVVDEEHEPTYIQDKAPRYNTKTVAAKIASLHRGAKLILGSATPLVADVFSAKSLNRPVIEMTELAKKEAEPAKISVVDMRNRDNFTSESRIFSRQMLEQMKSSLKEGKQILLFHNRRGTASTTMCENCGWVATCPTCFLPMTLHADKFELRCHLDNTRAKVPMKCPVCGSTEILHKGIGTKRIEDECRKIFREIISKDDKAIRRFDGDTANNETVAKVYSELKNGRTRIIIGTQQIAKGLDLPMLKMVGVVQADAGLNLPDFGAHERTFELITQAIGRVGRHSDETSAIIQTYQPESPAINFAKNQDFWSFYDAEITERKRAHFPPFTHLLKLTVSYKTEVAAVKNARKIANDVREKLAKDPLKPSFSVLGPSPSFYERLRENYRWQITVRSNSRSALNKIANEISRESPAKNLTIEQDANSLI